MGLAESTQFASNAMRTQLETQAVRERLQETSRRRNKINELNKLIGKMQLNENSKNQLAQLAQIDPDLALQQIGKSMFAQPSSLERKFSSVESRLGRTLTDEEILKLSGGGTTINVGQNNLDKTIPSTQLPNIQLPDGSSAPIGMTYREARDAGAKVLSNDESKRSTQVDNASAILSQLENLAVGENGIFTNVQPGVVNRAASAFDFALDWLSQDNPDVSRFRDLSEGTIGSLIRSMGESGALSDGDVQRALGLVPRIFPIPDTGRVARDKIRDLRSILNRGSDTPPPGVDPEDWAYMTAEERALWN
jgi:hypothetical protein